MMIADIAYAVEALILVGLIALTFAVASYKTRKEKERKKDDQISRQIDNALSGSPE